jgi:hypothetical protein
MTGAPARGIARAMLLLVALALPVYAQRAVPRSPRPLIRVDAVVADARTAVEGGTGIAIPASTYVRVGIEGAMGVTWLDAAVISGDRRRVSGRVDLLARVQLDPFREQRVGLHLGGGVGMQWLASARPAPTAIVLVGAEFGRRGALRPSVEVALARGVRVGMVLRRAPTNRR